MGAVGSTEITDLAITGADIAENTINLTKLYSPTIDSALYLRGDKTWANFTAEVLNAPLSTYVLDATTKPTVGVTDKIGPALGKIQKFLNDLNTDYISKTAVSQTVSGTFSFTSPTSFLYTQLPTGASPTEVTNVQYVNNYVGAAISGFGGSAPVTLTTADGGAAIGDLTLTVVSTVGYPSAGTLLVGNEAISYTGTTSTTFTGLTRGAYGTSAAPILNGATINNFLLLSKTTTTSSPKMVVTGSGNVGIGTYNPSTLLSFGKTSGAQSIITATALSTGTGDAGDLITYNNSLSQNLFRVNGSGGVTANGGFSANESAGFTLLGSWGQWRANSGRTTLTTTYGLELKNHSANFVNNSFPASGSFLDIRPTINQSGAFGYTGINLDVTENSIGTNTNYLLNMKVAGASQFVVTRSGGVGVGTSTPLEKLEVDGAIKIGSTSNTNAGTIRWDGFNFQGYNGSAWSNFVPTPPASSSCDTTVTFSLAGAYTYTVPASFGTITITMWGAGGSGGWSSNSLGGSGLNGESSSITSLGLFAGGGSGGGFSGGGTLSSPGNGGLATGGTTNSNGGNGGATSTSSGGAGGNAPNGGNGGSLAAIFSTGNNGVSPGGGGSGISSGNNGNNSGGGGSGSYTIKIFNSALITPGSTISDIIVGAGGAPVVNGGQLSGRGAPGRVSITCATSGSVATNDRGLIFWDSGAHTSDSNLVYTSSGYLGIGLPNPTYQLQLSTDSAAKPGTSTWTIASDERLKNIRAPFIRGLKDLLEVDTYYFTYKEDNLLGLPSNKEYVGIKAQQVLKVIPEAISKDKKGFFHVTNDSIIWTAINSIKELYYQLMGVDSKVKKLEAENIKLKLQVEKIEKDKTEIKAYLCLKDPAAPICK